MDVTLGNLNLDFNLYPPRRWGLEKCHELLREKNEWPSLCFLQARGMYVLKEEDEMFMFGMEMRPDILSR